MIELVTIKDIESLFSKLDVINERTKKHTEDIRELRKWLKELKDGLQRKML